MIKKTLRHWQCLTASILLVISAHSLATSKIEITDSHGKWSFDAPPQRIAVINWTLTEQILELGVKPLAIADISGFKATAPQTTVPAGIVDLGSRFTPNLNQLKALEPELIIIGYSQRDLLRPLSNIAPVMYFNNFSRRYENAKKADERFLTLATLFNQTAFAEHKLNERDKEISAIAEQINRHFDSTPPVLTIASIKDDAAWLFLNNSIPDFIRQTLGFQQSSMQQKPSKLGTHKVSLSDLANLDGCILLLNSDKLPSSFTQQSHQTRCVHYLATTNAYGGSLSQLYLARAIAKAFNINH